MALERVPASGGTYLLVLHAPQRAVITVGRLGMVTVAPGWYLYVGSALGPGGLRGRLRHHLRAARHPHWHIDYLRQVCEVIAVGYVVDERRWEHHWAARLAQVASPAPCCGFGASDCRCVAHAFQFAEAPALVACSLALESLHLDHPPMQWSTVDGGPLSTPASFTRPSPAPKLMGT